MDESIDFTVRRIAGLAVQIDYLAMRYAGKDAVDPSDLAELKEWVVEMQKLIAKLG